MSQQLTLTADNLIARGLHRECYQHPSDPALCIKVVVNGDDTETLREQAYYQHLKQHLTDWQSIPYFHGEVQTDKGLGAVFDLIRNVDGTVAKTLKHYLDDPALYKQYENILKTALQTLYQYQVEHNVLTMSLKPYNLLLQLDESQTQGKIYIIDGLGNSEFLPLANHLRLLGKAKIRRKWRRFNQLLHKQYPFLSNQFIAV